MVFNNIAMTVIIHACNIGCASCTVSWASPADVCTSKILNTITIYIAIGRGRSGKGDPDIDRRGVVVLYVSTDVKYSLRISTFLVYTSLSLYTYYIYI